MLIHHIPSLVSKLFPEFVWHKSREEKKVYLTFDDGPVAGITDFVLDKLRDRNQKATFFMVGDNIRKNTDLAQRVVLEGNQVGNHSYSHLNGFKTDTEIYLEDIQNCQTIIEEDLGLKTNLFRPPYGRITKKQFQKLKKSYQVIMWDVLSADFDPGQSAQNCLSKTKKYCQNGSIIVFHDQYKTQNIIREILDPFLDFLLENEFETDLLK